MVCKTAELFIILLNVFFLLESVSSDVCTTPACRKASSDILSFIDPSVDPCEDFYKFTCGSLFKKTYEAKPVSLEALVTKEVDEQTTLMLLKPIEFSEPKAVQGLKKFFRACMDEVSIEADGVNTIKKVLEQMGGWPVVDGPNWNHDDDFSFDRLLIKMRRMGYDFRQLFYFGTTISVEEQNLLVSEPALLKIDNKDKESYHDFMIDVALHLGADKQTASTELQEMVLFKMKLRRILENAGQINKTTIKNIQEEFPFLNWIRFINNIIFPNKKLSETDELYLPSFEYLSDLDNLLKETSNRTLANYIIWQAVEDMVPFLSSKFRELKQKYVQSTLGSEDEEEDENKFRLAFCKNQVRKILPPAFEILYLREYFTPEKRLKAQELVSLIQMELINLLNVTELYDDETRQKMLEKANAVTYIVGAPERLFDSKLLYEVFDEKENLNSDNLLTIVSILNRQRENFKLKSGNGITYLSYYEETTVLINTFYETFRNTLDVPAAVLQGLYFNERRPQYLNFGTIATMAAIELIRGFTQDGSKFDKDGNLDNLWTNESRRNFNKKAACLIREADSFSIEDSIIRMNGKQTLEKNICDYTGVEIAYRAYNSWVQTHGEEKQLPGLSYTTRQLFWISTASSFCDTVPLHKLKDFIEEEKQRHPTFRTFGALSNNKHFGKDFNCAIGSRMNPSYKCEVF